MTEDKELLELAAKAAEISIKWDENWNCFMRDARPVQEFDSEWLPWRPLTDDGDALRLAVKLRISFYRAESSDMLIECSYFDDETVSWIYIQEANDDPYLATRRAIVRAAAEIGKAM